MEVKGRLCRPLWRARDLFVHLFVFTSTTYGFLIPHASAMKCFSHSHSPVNILDSGKYSANGCLTLHAATRGDGSEGTTIDGRTTVSATKTTTTSTASIHNHPSSSSSLVQPFGRQEYWESFYDQPDADDFSWYASWEDMEPFVREWMPLGKNKGGDEKNYDGTVLVPGIGSDAVLLQSLYNAGYAQLAAFDYAPSSIAHCRTQLAATNLSDHIDWAVADATQTLPYSSDSMALVLDKGTLDAIYIADTSWLAMAVTQLQRVVAPGGIFWSLSGICTEALRGLDCWQGWEVCADSTVHLVTTRDGYTSNNLDGDLLVWRKPNER